MNSVLSPQASGALKDLVERGLKILYATEGEFRGSASLAEEEEVVDDQEDVGGMRKTASPLQRWIC